MYLALLNQLNTKQLHQIPIWSLLCCIFFLGNEVYTIGILGYPVVPKFSPVALLSQIAGIFFSLLRATELAPRGNVVRFAPQNKPFSVKILLACFCARLYSFLETFFLPLLCKNRVILSVKSSHCTNRAYSTAHALAKLRVFSRLSRAQMAVGNNLCRQNKNDQVYHFFLLHHCALDKLIHL